MPPSHVPRLGPSEAYTPQPPKTQLLASYACCQLAQMILDNPLFYNNLDKASKRRSICPCYAGEYGLANRMNLR